MFKNIITSKKRDQSILDQVSLKYKVLLYSGYKIVLTPYNHYKIVKTTPLSKQLEHNF
jgi:hypothetical protein